MLTSVQLAWLRDEVGPKPTDEILNERYTELGSVTGVAIAVLRGRRAALLASPLSVTVNGVASINNAENVKALDRRLAALAGLDDDPTSDPGEDPDGAAPVLEPVQLVRRRPR